MPAAAADSSEVSSSPALWSWTKSRNPCARRSAVAISGQPFMGDWTHCCSAGFRFSARFGEPEGPFWIVAGKHPDCVQSTGGLAGRSLSGRQPAPTAKCAVRPRRLLRRNWPRSFRWPPAGRNSGDFGVLKNSPCTCKFQALMQDECLLNCRIDVERTCGAQEVTR